MSSFDDLQALLRNFDALDEWRKSVEKSYGPLRGIEEALKHIRPYRMEGMPTLSVIAAIEHLRPKVGLMGLASNQEMQAAIKSLAGPIPLSELVPSALFHNLDSITLAAREILSGNALLQDSPLSALIQDKELQSTIRDLVSQPAVASLPSFTELSSAFDWVESYFTGFIDVDLPEALREVEIAVHDAPEVFEPRVIAERAEFQYFPLKARQFLLWVFVSYWMGLLTDIPPNELVQIFLLPTPAHQATQDDQDGNRPSDAGHIEHLALLRAILEQTSPHSTHYVSRDAPLRKGADSKARAISRLEEGQQVAVIVTQGGWAYIEYLHGNSRLPLNGWVARRHLKLLEE
jgi:hypothetical protein